MPYGFKFDSIKKINKVVPIKKEWGYYAHISKKEFYGLTQVYLKKGGIQPLYYFIKSSGILFVEEGLVLLRLIDKDGTKLALRLEPGNTFQVTPELVHGMAGLEESYVYFFSDGYHETGFYQIKNQKSTDFEISNNEKIKKLLNQKTTAFKVESTTDFRDKYWGTIETIVNKDFCGKRIFMKANTQNSLEIHCKKYETYFVHNGKVKIGLRVGRGENKSIILKKGDIFDIPPGLMHMKICTEDCVILEISTKDDDADSYLVEDGRKYVHVEN